MEKAKEIIRQRGFNLPDANCFSINLGKVADNREEAYGKEVLSEYRSELEAATASFGEIEKELYQHVISSQHTTRLNNCLGRIRYEKELLCKMLERLGLRCNENFFAQHINNPLDGFKYHKMEKRNLAAAYKFYTGRKMEDDFQAHLADQDTEATYLVLQGQLDMYAPGKQEEEDRVLNNDMEELAAFSKVNDNVDFAGRIVMKDNEEYFNFGKYKGHKVTDVLRMDPGYYSWMLQSDFTNNTKQVLTRIRLREFQKKN